MELILIYFSMNRESNLQLKVCRLQTVPLLNSLELHTPSMTSMGMLSRSYSDMWHYSHGARLVTAGKLGLGRGAQCRVHYLPTEGINS